MFRLSDPIRFPKQMMAVSLVAAPALLLLAFALHPDEVRTDKAEQLAVVGATSTRFYWAHLIALAGLALFVPATLGLMRVLHRRSTRLAHIGAIAAFVGIPATTAAVTMAIVEWMMATQPSGDRAAMAALLARLNEDNGVVLPFFLPGSLLLVGLVLFGIGLYRTRIVPRTAAALVIVGPVAWQLGFVVGGERAIVVGVGALTLGLGTVARRILSDAYDTESAIEPQPAAV